MKLSLGILAFNEAENIGDMLRSLCQQSIFHHAVPELTEIELFCIPNGCTDDTAAVARAALDANFAPAPSGTSLKATVHVISQAGKCNAWNVFTHELSDRNASYLGLMDADIFSLSPDCIANMVRLLLMNPHIQVATDRPIKTIPKGRAPAWFRKFSLASSAVGDPGIHAICGQMYLGRAQALRQIWLPSGLFVEDGFIRGCIVTDCCRAPEDLNRVRRAEGASHCFKGESDLRSIIRHEMNIRTGNYINSLLYRFLWSVSSSETNPVDRLRSECQKNPSWVRNLIRDDLAASSDFFARRSVIRKRWRRLKGLSPLRKITAFPVVFGGWIFDLYVARLSEAALRRGQGLGVR